MPQLLPGGKPICAATIRVGIGYLEVSCCVPRSGVGAASHQEAAGRAGTAPQKAMSSRPGKPKDIARRKTMRLRPAQVPFFATAEGKRNRGYGRALLEAIEDVAR